MITSLIALPITPYRSNNLISVFPGNSELHIQFEIGELYFQFELLR